MNLASKKKKPGRQNNNNNNGTATAYKIRAVSNFIVLIPSPSIRLGKFFLDFNFKRLYRSSRKGKENRFRLFTSSTKREIRHFHEVWCSCSNGKQNVRKKRKEKKKRAASAKMLLLISKPIPLLTFSFLSLSLLLKLLSVLLQTGYLRLLCLIGLKLFLIQLRLIHSYGSTG